MKNIFIVIAILFILVGCVPTSHVYVKSDYNDNQLIINNVLVLVEYLEIKDDFRGLWNFEEDINLIQQDELFAIAEQMLIGKGYKVADSSLKTSGFIIARDFLVEHYINKERQPYAISPPYIIRSVNLTDGNIQGLEMLLAELNRPLSPAMSDLRAYIKNNYKEQTSTISLANETAILIIQGYRPRASVFTSIDMGFSTSSFGNSSYVGLAGNSQRSTGYAYFIHKGTGDLIWSNKTSLINTSTQEKFFRELPEKRHSAKKLSE